MQKHLTPFLILALLGAGCRSSIVPSSPLPPVETPSPSMPPVITPPSVHHPNDLIYVEGLGANQKVTSPLRIQGKAVGPWYFEAVFPIELFDGNGTSLVQGQGTAQGDWMTTSLVPFTASLVFAPPSTATGTLILKKDNPSGEPANDDQLTIPVTF